MLYKKNKAAKLEDELFENPTSEYRGTPLWAWNCKMTPEILTKQIGYLKEMGFGGFHMHSRSGMDNEYLSEEFMGLIRACVDKAKEENMLAYLYDEDRWPSGAAGGYVTREPRYRCRGLFFVPAEKTLVGEKYRAEGDIKKANGVKKDSARGVFNEPIFNAESNIYDYSDELPKKDAIAQGKPYLVATYDITLGEDGALESYEMIERNINAKGTKWYAFCAPQQLSGWYNGYCYVDTLSKDAIKRFIEITHETYKKYVGDEFDKTVPSIFTDEPQFMRKQMLNNPMDKTRCQLTWTPDFPKTYKKAYGEDILPYLPEILWDLPNEKASVARYRYHDHICERFTDAFAALCGKWCDKNNIKLTGHMMMESPLFLQTSAVGETMRAYKYFGYPGMDMLYKNIELNTAKQTQSVVRQYGKEAMACEIYGVTNWDFDFRGHKFFGDWQAALGVTIRVPHLAWVSMKGNGKRDYPASINYQSPWYKEYPYIENHFARINTALTRGRPHVSIAVIHPIESYWLHWGPERSTAAVRNHLEERFDNLINWLLFAQLDFDYISESLLPDECKVAGFPLCVGKMKYNTVIVPAMETMRRSTLERLKAFKEAGGKLIFLGECPSLIDAAPSDEVRSLYDSSEVVAFERKPILDVLEADRKVEIRLSNGNLADNYIYQMRDDGKYRWLFIANAKKYNLADVVRPKKVYIKLKGEFKPLVYDTLGGKIKEISYRCEKGHTYLEFTLYLHDSLLLRLEKTRVKSFAVAEEKTKTLGAVEFRGRVQYEREEPNVMVLDMAEYKVDGEKEYHPTDEILRIDTRVRRMASIPPKTGAQPWTIKPEPITHSVTLKFTFNSEAEVDGAHFALEDAEQASILYDGSHIDNTPDGYFTDEAIKTVALPTITMGTHTIEVTLPLGTRTYTEWCYLLGEFNVRLEGTEKTIIPKTEKIGFGDIGAQGLPFYGGNITYKCEVCVPEDEVRLKIHSNFYRGSLISVRVDGKESGKIVFAPYNVYSEPLSVGKHTVEFKLFGNRHNSFGAMHNAEIDTNWIGPTSWSTGGDAWCFEYRTRELGIMVSPIIEFVK